MPDHFGAFRPHMLPDDHTTPLPIPDRRPHGSTYRGSKPHYDPKNPTKSMRKFVGNVPVVTYDEEARWAAWEVYANGSKTTFLTNKRHELHFGLQF